MKPSAILLSTAAMVAALLTDAPADLLVGDTFESDVVNLSPRVALGTDPAGWGNDFGDSLNGNGLTDVSVEGVGSPQGGSQSMLFYDSNGVDGRIAYSRTFTSTSSSNVMVTLDLRVNSVLNTAQDKFALRLFATTGLGIGFELSANGSSTSLNMIPLSHTNASALQTITVGDWYRISLLAPSVDSGSPDWQMSLYHYASATTNAYALTRPDAPSGGYWRIYLQSGYANANTLDMNLDNVTVETVSVVPEPATALLLFGGGLLMWRRLQRRGAARQ